MFVFDKKESVQLIFRLSLSPSIPETSEQTKRSHRHAEQGTSSTCVQSRKLRVKLYVHLFNGDGNQNNWWRPCNGASRQQLTKGEDKTYWLAAVQAVSLAAAELILSNY